MLASILDATKNFPEDDISPTGEDDATMTTRLAARHAEARRRVEELKGTWILQHAHAERRNMEQKRLHAEAITKEKQGSRGAGATRTAPIRDDRLLVVTSLDDRNWSQTTYYPTKRYHITNVSYSRAMRRREGTAASRTRSPGTSRGFSARSTVSMTWRPLTGTTATSCAGSRDDYLKVSTPPDTSLLPPNSRGAQHPSRLSDPLTNTPAAAWDAVPRRRGPHSLKSAHHHAAAGPHRTACTSSLAQDAVQATGITSVSDDAAEREVRGLVSSSRQPPEGFVEPLSFPRHAPVACLPVHGNPLLATRLGLIAGSQFLRNQKLAGQVSSWSHDDGSQTERARGKQSWGGLPAVEEGRDMTAWAKVCDVLPISPRRQVVACLRDLRKEAASLKEEGDGEYAPLVAKGTPNGVRLRHMGPWKGGGGGEDRGMGATGVLQRRSLASGRMEPILRDSPARRKDLDEGVVYLEGLWSHDASNFPPPDALQPYASPREAKRQGLLVHRTWEEPTLLHPHMRSRNTRGLGGGGDGSRRPPIGTLGGAANFSVPSASLDTPTTSGPDRQLLGRAGRRSLGGSKVKGKRGNLIPAGVLPGGDVLGGMVTRGGSATAQGGVAGAAGDGDVGPLAGGTRGQTGGSVTFWDEGAERRCSLPAVVCLPAAGGVVVSRAKVTGGGVSGAGARKGVVTARCPASGEELVLDSRGSDVQWEGPMP